jgi:hypothetical protein
MRVYRFRWLPSQVRYIYIVGLSLLIKLSAGVQTSQIIDVKANIEMQKKFVYQPLDGDDIRLLSLLPGPRFN